MMFLLPRILNCDSVLVWYIYMCRRLGETRCLHQIIHNTTIKYLLPRSSEAVLTRIRLNVSISEYHSLVLGLKHTFEIVLWFFHFVWTLESLLHNSVKVLFPPPLLWVSKFIRLKSTEILCYSGVKLGCSHLREGHRMIKVW